MDTTKVYQSIPWQPPHLSSTELCPEFKVENSTHESWGVTTAAGDKVTVTCQDNHVLEGNSELTCNSDGSWSSDPPKCINGKILNFNQVCSFELKHIMRI